MRYPLGKFAMILAEVGQEICGEGDHESNVTKKGGLHFVSKKYRNALCIM